MEGGAASSRLRIVLGILSLAAIVLTFSAGRAMFRVYAFELEPNTAVLSGCRPDEPQPACVERHRPSLVIAWVLVGAALLAWGVVVLVARRAWGYG